MIFDFFILEMRGRWDGINGKFVKERIIRHVKYYSIRSFFFFIVQFEIRVSKKLESDSKMFRYRKYEIL